MLFPEVPEHLRNRDLRAADLDDMGAALLQTYGWMHYSRVADNRILELFRQGKMKGTVTGAQGNEALATAVGLFLDKDIDVVSWTHRGLPGHLIWSSHLVEHLCQYLANSSSPTKAREGNVHHGDPANRSYPMISHLGAMLSNVLGGTDSQRRAGHKAIGVAFFGDGGSSTGDVHESMNMASLLNLPVAFIIENNKYAYSTPVSEQFYGNELASRAAGYGMEGIRLDGKDTEAVLRGISEVLDKVRDTGRPILVEVDTLRLRGHAAYDTCDYLPDGLLEEWESIDALPNLRARLIAEGQEEVVTNLEATNATFVEDCLAEAMKVPPPKSEILEHDVLAPTRLDPQWKPGPMTERLTFAQALQRALHKILTERPESLVMGQDIADYGGAFKVTEHLLEEFGRERVLNTPVAESATTGFATGLAVNGHRPIVEFQFADFATDATTQLLLNAGTYHFRSGAKVPMVVRLPCGGGLTFGSFHSQDLESIYAHAPGLKILYPSNPQDAFNAMLAAYEDDNPVLIFEHKRLYRLTRAEVAYDPDYRSIWHPRKVRQGTHGTIISYGEMLLLSVEATDYLTKEYGYTFDVFDLRSLAPLDLAAIKASVANTHRICVVHEGRRNCGFGAELVTRIVAEHFHDLDAAPLRIASADTPVPFAPELEAAYRPSRDGIIEELIEWFE